MDAERVVEGVGVEEPGEQPFGLLVPVLDAFGVVEEAGEVGARQTLDLEAHSLVAQLPVQLVQAQALDQLAEGFGVPAVVALAPEDQEDVQVRVLVGGAIGDGGGDGRRQQVFDVGQVVSDRGQQVLLECVRGGFAQAYGVGARIWVHGGTVLSRGSGGRWSTTGCAAGPRPHPGAGAARNGWAGATTFGRSAPGGVPARRGPVGKAG